MAAGESMTCSATGIAVGGQYTNVATVNGVDENGGTPGDTDPSNYFGAGPAISLEKATNTVDADVAPGPTLAVGDAVTWTYVVTNTGNVDLDSIVLTDDIEGVITCPATTLAVGDSFTCTATGIATAGQYTNNADVTGIDPVGTAVSDADPSNYFGAGPGIDVEKATNTVDADVAPGPDVAVGDVVTWTYVVTNTGNVDLGSIVLTDDIEGAIPCPATTLAVGESMTCTATGIAIDGQYTNIADVTGVDPAGAAVADADPSNYFGTTLLGSISDKVFEDLDRDGVQDPSEPGVGGVVVNLLDADGTVLATTTTAADGTYLFDGLVSGTYQVEFIAPAGTQITVSEQGADSGVDSDADPATGITADIALGAGEDRLDVDAGIIAVLIPVVPTNPPQAPGAPQAPQLNGPGTINNAPEILGTIPNPQPSEPLTTTAEPLAFTGSSSLVLASIASLLFSAGTVLVIGVRRRDQDDEI